MNLNAILNADMSTVGRWLSAGVAWWTDELRGLIPARWRERLSPRQDVIAQLAGDDFVFWRNADGAATLFRPKGTVRKARLLLPPETVLEREIELPSLSERDTRQMVSLELDRLTPFAADDVYWDIAYTQASDGGRQRAIMAVLRRSDAAALLATAQQRDIGIRAISVGPSPAEGPSRFDFCPAMRRARAMPRTTAPFWWSLAAVLLVLNAGLMVWRDTIATDQLRALADSQKVRVELAMRVHDRASAEAASRTRFLDHRNQTRPLPILEALTRALPPPAWVRRLDWDGTSLQLSGYKDPRFDIARAVASSRIFINVNADNGPSPENVSVQPFEVSADVKRSASR